MVTLVYDGTYEGWLTAVFHVFDHKIQDVTFCTDQPSPTLLPSVTEQVVTDEIKALRVFNGLQKRLSDDGMKRLHKTFLSDVKEPENLMLRFVRHVFASNVNVEEDFGNEAVWGVKAAARRVKKEAHRMTAFVRFKLTKDELYYAIIEPECDVLFLISSHFYSRYADQRWLIYDAKRKYGIYYDLEKVTTVQIDFNHGPASSRLIKEITDEKEEFYQELWRRYFKSTNIESRKNTRLHMQHMPKRYWKHLTEKNLGF